MATQAGQVRDDIIKRVLARDLLPGDRIDEVDLRQRLELSGTPVREALIALEATGVIERRPRDGARIMALDLGGLLKMNEALAEAEGAIAFRPARRINAQQAKIVGERLADCLNYANAQDRPSTPYYDLDLAFHQALLQASGNEFMMETAFFLGNRMIGYLSARHELPNVAINSALEHQAIFKAILDSDGDLARSLMIDHVTFSDTVALDVMNALRATAG